MASLSLRSTLAALLLASIVAISTALPPQAFRDASLRFHAKPTLIGKFPYKSAAFTNLRQLPRQPGDTTLKYDLLLSAFGVFSSDVAIVKDVGRFFRNVSSIVPTSLTKSMKWPNQVSYVPDQVFRDQTEYIAIPDGFLVPGKSSGSVTLQPLNGGASHVISGGKGTWFYHRVLWFDMDKDGRLDALTCRADKPFFGPSKGQLVFFKNPGSPSGPWKDTVLASGPDVLFRLGNLTVPGRPAGKEVIVTVEFFNPRLRIFWVNNDRDTWTSPNDVQFRDIDHIPGAVGTGKPFDVLIEDLNKDGKKEIIVTFNDAKNGTVVIYEVPDDFRNGTFKRHIIASGYFAEQTAPDSGAPGILSLLPGRKPEHKPIILVSGDDSGIISTLEATHPTDPNDWSYTRTDVIHTQKSTMGGTTVADVDGDGTLEIFAPSYEEGVVYVFRDYN